MDITNITIHASVTQGGWLAKGLKTYCLIELVELALERLLGISWVGKHPSKFRQGDSTGQRVQNTAAGSYSQCTFLLTALDEDIFLAILNNFSNLFLTIDSIKSRAREQFLTFCFTTKFHLFYINRPIRTCIQVLKSCRELCWNTVRESRQFIAKTDNL